MIKPLIASALILAVTSAAGAVACGGAVVEEPVNPRSDAPDQTSSAPSQSGTSRDPDDSPRSSPPSPGDGTPPPPPRACCPADPAPSGSMLMGGVWNGNSCTRASDFWCSMNWRLETDGFGCPVWKYDVRKPAPDEDSYCQPARTCTPGNYVFCRCPDNSAGTTLCNDDGTLGACGPCN